LELEKGEVVVDRLDTTAVFLVFDYLSKYTDAYSSGRTSRSEAILTSELEA
jgi:hypothetical protein